MNGRRTLTISFEVLDDLTSERAADYRETIVNALLFHAAVGNPDDAELQRIDRMLNDCNRDAVSREIDPRTWEPYR